MSAFKVGDKTTMTNLGTKDPSKVVVPVTLLSRAGKREWFVETDDGKAYRASEDWLSKETK